MVFGSELPGLGLRGHILKHIPALSKTPTSVIIKKKDVQTQNKKDDIAHQHLPGR